MYAPHEVKLAYTVFITLCAILIGFIVLFIVTFRKRQNELILKNQLEEQQLKNELLSKEIENQQNLVKERERISEDIHDDIGGILSAIKLEAEFTKQRIIDEDNKKSLESIAENTITATQNFRELIWCLHSQNDTLVEFIHYIASYTQLLFDRSPIKMKINLPIIHDEILMNSQQRRQLLLAIKECLNNIIKHSQASLAELSLTYENKRLMIIISDNGIGHQLTSMKGHGLKNIEKRIQTIKGTIENLSSLENGTKITLVAPL